NDIFAFFISGPGIVGDPALDNQRNIAILPNAEQTVVEINSVNNDTNFEYFRNNQIGQSVEYDGLTSGFLGRKKSLTARADVIPCNTYTLKLAVADRGDNLYDSGVFVSDIRGGAPRAEIDFVSGLDYLVEDCTSISDTLVVTLTNNSDSVVTYDLNVLGTATLDDDYTILGLPDSIEFQPGDNEFVFPITVLSDMVEEGTETIIFNFVIDFGCGSTVVSSLEVLLRDRLEVTINNDADTTIFCAGDGAGLTVQGAQTYLWSPEDIIDDPMGETVFVMPESDTIVQVIGFLENCTDTATIFLQEIDPFIEILNGDTLNFCEGDTIQLLQNNNLENSNLVWVPEFAILDDSPDPLNPLISPLFNVNYVVTSTLEGCSVSDTIFVDVKELVIPEMANDTSICEGYSFQPASAFVPFTPETEYDWTPGIHFADSTDVNSTMIPAPGTQEYTLISTTTNGACADTQSIVITEIPARIEILNGDTLEVCAGYDPIELQANISPMGGSAVDWFPDGGGLTPSTGLNYTVQPPISVRYFATYEVNGCPQIDSVLVKVDSLPANMDIEVDPFKDPYCQGDTFFLRSPIFDVGDFPGITHMWFDAPGLQTGDSLYNGFVIAQDTSLFFRVATNGACVDTNEIQINVVQPPQFTLTPQDTSICPGGSVQYQFTIEEGTSGELEWMPDDGSLSCTDCFDPVATPSAPVEYMISLVADGSDCSFPLTATIGFRNQPNVVLPTNPVICPNDQLVLLLNGRQAGVEYRLTGGGLDTDDPLTPVSPLTNTTYTITASNECGMVEETVTVTVIQPQNVQIQGPTEACEGDLLTFTAPTTVPTGTTEQYSWFVNGNFVDNEPTLTVEAVLNMNVRLTYTNRCETVLATATVDITPLPTLTVTNVRRICRGDNLSLASVVNAATTSYQWSGTDGFSSMLPNPNVSPTETTTYTVIATSGPLCDATEESFTVEVVQPFTVSAGASQTICAGDATTLTATTDPANLAGSYAWSGPNIEGPIDQATASVRPDATTTYTVSFLDSDGCFTETATVVVNVIPAPTLTVTNQTSICEGETIPLAIDVDPSTTTYQWSGTDGFTSTDPNPSVSPTTTTTYTVIATTDPDCPSVTTSFTIEVNPTYTLNIDPDITICEGETISVTASTDPTGIAGTYQWSGPNIQGPTDGPSIDVAPTSDATYSVTFTDAEGCFPATIASSSVTVLAALPEPNVTITQNGSLVDSIVFGGTEVTLVADNPPAGLTYTYEWDGNGDPSMGTGQSFTFTAPQIDGTVTYLLMITSEPGGCMVDAPVTVSVQEAKFEIPQLITPNRDGVNDGFRVFFNGSLQDFNLIIFNRWGQEVFQTNDPTQAWDGSRNGVAQPMDTYLYKVIFSQNGISSERDGEFQLIR
ncbi:MAG: choice-of-anchor L domain-containing protein, partial [Bacteroidota bacterium]